ncbi:MAG TPA: hypothetical protein VIK97_19450 [Casimicrobiaceae bacterium]
MAHGPMAAQDWASRRRAQPANYMLPASIRRFAELPAALRPVALAARYPRLVNQIAQAWRSPSATHERFDDLLTDHRGGRRGFPQDVQRELVALHDYYISTFLTLED